MERFGLAPRADDEDPRIRIPYKCTTVRQSLLSCPNAGEQKNTVISKLRDFFFEFDDGRLQCVVNQMFISYPMKDGMCRLINQNGVDKYKIANSSAKRFVDLSLSFAEDNLLATLDQAGIVSLWKVMSNDYTYLLDLHFPPSEEVRRVILDRTHGAEFFVTIHHDFVRIWNLTSLKAVIQEPKRFQVQAKASAGRKQPEVAIDCTDWFLSQVSTKFPLLNFRSLCWGIDQQSLFIASQDKVILLDIASEDCNTELRPPILTERRSVQVTDNEICSVNVLDGSDDAKVLVVGSEDDSCFKFYLYEDGIRHLQSIRFRTDAGARTRRGLVAVNREREEERDVLVLLQEQNAATKLGDSNLEPATQQTILCMRLSPFKQSNWLPIQSILRIPCPDSSATLQTVTGMPNAPVEGQSIFFFLSHNRSTDTRGSVIYCQSVNHSLITTSLNTDGIFPAPVTDDVCDLAIEPQKNHDAPDGRRNFFVNGHQEISDNKAFDNLGSSMLNQKLLHQLADVVSTEMDKSKEEADDRINSIMQQAFDDTDQMLAKELTQAMAMVEDGANACNGKVQEMKWSFAAYERQVMSSATQSLRDTVDSALNDLAPQLRVELEKVGNTLVDAIASEVASNKEFGDSLGQAQPKAITNHTIDALRPSKQMIQETIQTILPDLIEKTVSQYFLAEMRNLFEANVFPVLETSLQELVKRHTEETVEMMQTELIGPLSEEIASMQRSVIELQQRVDGVNAPKIDNVQRVFHLFHDDKEEDAFLMAIKSQANGEEDLLTPLCGNVPVDNVEIWLSYGKLSDELTLFLALSLAQQLNTDAHRLSDECIFAKIAWIREITIYLLAAAAHGSRPKKNIGQVATKNVIKPLLDALGAFKTGPRGALVTAQEHKFLSRLVRALD